MAPSGAKENIMNQEYTQDTFCEDGGILPDSPLGTAIKGLSDEQFRELESIVEPSEDYLIHVDSGGFTVNHGNVGTHGIRYEFSRA
jgi:hypothetical protein